MLKTKMRKMLLYICLTSALGITLPNTAYAAPWDTIISDIEKIYTFITNTVPNAFDTAFDYFTKFSGFIGPKAKNTDQDQDIQKQMVSTYQTNKDTTNTVAVQSNTFNQFLSGSSDTMKNKIEAYKSKDTYKEGDKTYSTTDSNTLYLNDEHSDVQSKAAKEYIRNASGANIGIPKVQYRKATPEAVSSVAYNKFISAQANSASNSLTEAYASRQKTSMGTSKKKLMSNMSVGNTQKKSFFESFNNVPILGGILTAGHQVMTMSHQVHDISKTASGVKAQTSNLATQTTMLSQHTVGNQLNANAASSQPGALINKTRAHH